MKRNVDVARPVHKLTDENEGKRYSLFFLGLLGALSILDGPFEAIKNIFLSIYVRTTAIICSETAYTYMFA